MEDNYFLRIELIGNIVNDFSIFDLSEMIQINSDKTNARYLSKEYLFAVINLYKTIPITIHQYELLQKNPFKKINKLSFIKMYEIEEYFI